MSLPQTSYANKLSQLQRALASLPLALPLGSSIHDFCGWTPDPDRVEDYGTECGALNAHLESVFGLRVGGRVSIVERGPGIESNVDIFTRYLTGDYREQPVIAKWLDDLIDTAEDISNTSALLSQNVIMYPSSTKEAEYDADLSSDSDSDCDEVPSSTLTDSMMLECTYGVNFSSRVLEDHLSDRAQALKSVNVGSSQPSAPTTPQGTLASTKKDVGGINLEVY
ncbi:hypothetical protein FRC07_012737 [Ceratobasidium sp. 392]|nr:hypothetical protein FRC07_012737 [Ceratobasidium sp. 392]